MKDICCIGHITQDRVITPRSTVDMAGGTSFYFSYGISQLPPKVSYQLVTAVGQEGQPVVEKMRHDGIDVKAYPSRHSVFFENRYGENMNNREQRVLAKADPFSISQLEDVDAKVYHLGSLLADDFPDELVEYLAGKGKISIDVQGYLRRVEDNRVIACEWPSKLRVLKHTDILKLNEFETEAITGLHDIKEVARLIASWGVEEVVITLGDYGSVIYAGGQFYDIPAYKPRAIVDATGCGDAYSAGYLYCRCQGATPHEAGRFAAAMCTLKLEHSGPFDKTIDDILRVMNN